MPNKKKNVLQQNPTLCLALTAKQLSHKGSEKPAAVEAIKCNPTMAIAISARRDNLRTRAN